MAIKKIADVAMIGAENLVSTATVISQMETNDVVSDRFKKMTGLLREAQAKASGKKLTPKVEDFTYFSTIMMHAAEAALINQDTGEPLMNKKGQPVKGGFEKVLDSRGRESVKWVSADGIMPYKNQNRDIFPEEDLIAKHKDWIGKPLCRDHVSATVDGVRGIIVDTYYDPKFKRVHALAALDKKNYPDLARKVEAGYATSVSMGTAVGRAICSDCSNVATVESEYCSCARSKTSYGEVNKDLSPIELSIVVTGADPRAKIKTVLASMQNYVEKKEEEFRALAGGMKLAEEMKMDLAEVIDATNKLEESEMDDSQLERLARQAKRHKLPEHEELLDILIDRASKNGQISKARMGELLELIDVGDTERVEKVRALSGSIKDVKPQGDNEFNRTTSMDSAGYSPSDGSADVAGAPMLPTDIKAPNPMAAFTSFYQTNMTKGSSWNKNAESMEVKISNLTNKMNRLEAAIESTKEKPMNFAELKERSLRRLAYHQGTEKPQKYAPMGDADKIRNTQDKQMSGDELDTSVENPDAKLKELVQRASLEERAARRAALVEKAKTANANEVNTYKVDGKDVKTVVGPDGKEKVLSQAADDGKEDGKDTKKTAYWQGTEQPTPGKPRYAPMGDADKIRNTQDKQMSGATSASGPDGLAAGDEQKKRYWQRMASITAKRSLGSNIKEAKWDVFADGKRVLTVTADHAYEGLLDKQVTETNEELTYGEHFTSEAYGKGLIGLVRQAGPDGAAAELNLAAPAAPAAAPEGPAADKSDLDGARDKVTEAISSIEDAVEDIRGSLGIDGIKDISVDALPEPSEKGAEQALASSQNTLLKVYAAMTDAAAELTNLDSALAEGNVEAASVVAEAVADATELVAFARSEIEVFAKKKDKSKGKDDKKEKADKKDKEKDDKAKAKGKDKDKDEKEDKKDKLKKKKSDSELLSELLQARAAKREAFVATANADEVAGVDLGAEDELQQLLDELAASGELEQADHDMEISDAGEMHADDGQAALDKEEKKEAKEIANKEVDKHEEDMHEKKAARKAWREAVAAKAIADLNKTYSDTRKGNGETVKFDVKPSGDLALVENLHTQQAKDLEVAQSQPRNVRMAAEALNEMIVKGAIAAADLDALVAKGAVDSEAAKYWKEYWGQADSGKEFAAGLIKDFKQSKASVESPEVREIKLRRAYALGLEAQDRGIISKSRADLEKYVDSMSKLPDEAFEHMKAVVAQHKPAKVATAAIQVGVNYDRDVEQTEVATRNSGVPTFAELASLFS